MKKTEIIKELGQPKINRLMNEKKYWLIISTAFSYNSGAASNSELDQRLDKLLSTLSLKEVAQFHLRITDLMNKLHSSKIGTASIIMNGKHIQLCNWNYHESFRSWIISLGERVFKQIIKDPDFLVNFAIDRFDKYYFYHGLNSSAAWEFKERTGQEIEDFIELSKVSDKIEPIISQDYRSIDVAQNTCPNLFNKFKYINEKRDREEKKFQKRIQKSREESNQFKNVS